MKWIYWAGYNTFKCLGRALFDLQVVHPERLIQDQPVLIAANHESFVDPPLIGVSYDEEIHYLARKTLFKGPTKWLYPRWNAIPVDQENPDMSSLKTVIKKLKEGKRVLVFPEGERTLDGSLGAGQPGIGLIVSKAKVPVQPIRIVGARQALPRGSGRMKCHPIRIIVGEPIYFDEARLKAKGKEAYQSISQEIMDAVGALELP